MKPQPQPNEPMGSDHPRIHTEQQANQQAEPLPLEWFCFEGLSDLNENKVLEKIPIGYIDESVLHC
jgi:hypothetical protein